MKNPERTAIGDKPQELKETERRGRAIQRSRF